MKKEHGWKGWEEKDLDSFCDKVWLEPPISAVLRLNLHASKVPHQLIQLQHEYFSQVETSSKPSLQLLQYKNLILKDETTIL